MSEQSTPARIPQQVEYREVPGFVGYRVGDDGSVWTCRRHSGGRIGHSRGGSHSDQVGDVYRRLNLYTTALGYKSVGLWRGGKRRPRLAHRLVLEAFVGPRPEGLECRHLDGDPANNHVGNLAWGTRMENAEDQTRHGTRPRGGRNGAAKLTEEIVLQIRRDLAAGRTQDSIAAERHVSQSMVSLIALRRSWGWLSDQKETP